MSDQLTIPPVVLRVDEAIIGTLGNFSVSTGKAKAKKTFNVCALVAAALINGQVLEYRASFPESKRDILYFDTEQSPYHCQLVMQRILSLAGLPLDQEPEHLKFSHLRAIADPNQRRALIRYAIYNSTNLGLVVIDGIRDLMYDINNSAEATNLVGDLMQWTGEKNIHIQTVLHLNKGDDNARGHIGTELNNKAESVLLIAKDTKDADRSVVSPAVIRSKAFAPFAFKLSEDDGICLPELDTEFAVTNSPSFSYQELSGEEHRKALQETFKTDTELGYGVWHQKIVFHREASLCFEYLKTSLLPSLGRENPVGLMKNKKLWNRRIRVDDPPRRCLKNENIKYYFDSIRWSTPYRAKLVKPLCRALSFCDNSSPKQR